MYKRLSCPHTAPLGPSPAGSRVGPQNVLQQQWAMGTRVGRVSADVGPPRSWQWGHRGWVCPRARAKLWLLGHRAWAGGEGRAEGRRSWAQSHLHTQAATPYSDCSTQGSWPFTSPQLLCCWLRTTVPSRCLPRDTEPDRRHRTHNVMVFVLRLEASNWFPPHTTSLLRQLP